MTNPGAIEQASQHWLAQHVPTALPADAHRSPAPIQTRNERRCWRHTASRHPCTRRPVFAYKVYRKYAECEQAHTIITMVPAAGVFGSEHQSGRAKLSV